MQQMQQVDPRYLQSQNHQLRQELGRITGSLNNLDQKYQKALKQMSSIIHANQNLKQELDALKNTAGAQLDRALRETKLSFEGKLEDLIRDKNQLALSVQNLTREKEQLQRDYIGVEKSMWENEALRAEVAALKKENERLLLQNHTLAATQENPEHKALEQKYMGRIEEMSKKVGELNSQIGLDAQTIANLRKQNEARNQETQAKDQKIQQLTASLQALRNESKKQENTEISHKIAQVKSQQVEILDLRRKIVDLQNEAEKLRLEKVEIISEANRTQSQLHLLDTLRSLHSQLEPLRYEIEQLKRDKFYERESNTKQKAQLQIKLLAAEHQLSSLREYIKELEEKSRALGQEIRSKQWQKYRFQQLQEDKRMLQGRVIVYEAMQMVSKNRDQSRQVQRIQQFQRRIQVLLQQQNLSYLVTNANVHQLIAMKAYVLELDNKLLVAAEQNEHFHKKYQHYKDKYMQAVEENKKIISKHYTTVSAYKGKVAGYEKLVVKLTNELDRLLKETDGVTAENNYRSVLTLYETKILSLNNEINAKKQEHRDLSSRHDSLESQIKAKNSKIAQLQAQVSRYRAQVQQLTNKLSLNNAQEPRAPGGSSQDQFKLIISQKTTQIVQLEQQLSRYRTKLDNIESQHRRNIEQYRRRINRLEIEAEQLRLEQAEAYKQLSTAKNTQELEHLLSKVSQLENNVTNMSRSQVVGVSQHEAELQRHLDKLSFENSGLLREVDRLRQELSRGSHGAFYEQEIRMIKMQLGQFQSHAQQLQNQLKLRERQHELKISELLREQSHGSIHEQNLRLKTELQILKNNYRIMTLECEGLMAKVNKEQEIIRTLRMEFENVNMKLSEYERTIVEKDGIIKQISYKYDRHFGNGHQGSTITISDFDEKRLQDLQADLHRLRRDLQSKQAELNHRQTQYQNRNRDLLERLTKIQHRQAIVLEEEDRLNKWSSQLQQLRQRMSSESPSRMIRTTSVIHQLADTPTREDLQELEHRLRELEREIGERERYTLRLQIELGEVKNQRNYLVKDVSSLQSELESKERQVKKLKREIDQIMISHSGDGGHDGNLKAELMEKQKYILRLQIEMKQVKNQRNYLVRDLQSMQIQIREKQTLISKLRLEVNEARKYREPPKNESSQKQAYIVKLQIQLNQVKNQRNYAVRDLKNMENQLIQINKQMTRLRIECTEAKSQRDRLLREIQSTRSVYEQRNYEYDANFRQITELKQEKLTLETELYQHQRQITELKSRIKSYEAELRQKSELIFKIQSLKPQSPLHPYPPISTDFQTQLSLLQTSHSERIRQLTLSHQQSIQQLQQIIADQMQTIAALRSAPTTNTQIQEINGHTAAMESLQGHITSLEQELRKRERNQKQLDEEMKYYKGLLDKRDKELEEALRNVFTSGRSQSSELGLLRQEVSRLQEHSRQAEQNYIQNQQGLRNELESLKKLLSAGKQSSVHAFEPHADTSYLLELEEANRKLQQDLDLQKLRLIAQFDSKRSIEDYMAIMVITFVEVQALRQRVTELERNFKQQHQRSMEVLKKIDELKQHQIDVDRVMNILKELQQSHKIFHEQEQKSKTLFIQKISSEAVHNQSATSSVSSHSIVNPYIQIDKTRVPFQHFRPVADSINSYSDNQFSIVIDSSKGGDGGYQLGQGMIQQGTATRISVGQYGQSTAYTSNAGTVLQRPFNFSPVKDPTPAGITFNNYAMHETQILNPSTTAPAFYPAPESRTTFLSNYSQMGPQGSPNKIQLFSPEGKLSPPNVQLGQFYQYSDNSQSSIRFPSESSLGGSYGFR